MTQSPRVTVVMAVHNGAASVRSAVESVLAQTYADFELLVVDDASTDGSGDIVRAIGDPRVRVVANSTNLGLTKSLNEGLALARGELVARHDADDLSHPERLAKQVAFLAEHPDVTLVGSWYRKVDANGETLGTRTLPADHARLCWALLFYCPFVHSAVVFRRAPVIELGGYDARFVYAQDYDLWSRTARHGRLANVAETLVDYRQGPATMTSTVGAGSDEVLTVAGRNIADVGAVVPTAEAHRAMGAVVTADASRVGPNDVRPTIDRVLEVLDRFCASTRLTTDEMSVVREDVTRAAARVTVAHAGRLTDAEYLGVRSRLTASRSEVAELLPASRRVAALGRVMHDLIPKPLRRSTSP